MNSIVLVGIGIIGFFLAFRFYSTFISRHIFNLEELDEQNVPTPAFKLRDDIDYVPTKKSILFGHHFSSIAGAAPIVGPAVAAIWGWVPAFLWVFFGVIFMGACHDFGTLVLSMKNKGHSIASVAENLVGKRVKNLLLVIIFFLVWMVIAVFALVIANLFIQFPGAVIPVNFEIIIAVMMGLFINKGGSSLKVPSVLAQLGLLVMIYIGSLFPISLEPIFGQYQLVAWIIFLLIYSFVASTLPVWVLLQPRDYINSHQLVLGLLLMTLGLFVTRPEIVAPALNLYPEGAPSWFPFLFITIACGAISGFHGLVSGGTTSKQVRKWSDARTIGYGSMLMEGLLALLATLAVTAGFKSAEHWHFHYASWNKANGLSAKISAFVTGSSSFLGGLGIPENISEIVIAVLIISFAATSLDTATRIQRYIIGELGEELKIKSLKNRYLGGAIAIGSAFLLMMSANQGKGGLIIWPLFGATNQMLASLSLVIVSVYLIREGKKKKSLIFLIPAVLVSFVTAISLGMNIVDYCKASKYFLFSLGMILFLSQLAVIFESIRIVRQSAK